MPTALRTTPPAVRPVEDVRFRHPERFELANGVPVYAVHGDEQDIVRIDAVFRGGRRFEHAHGVAGAAARLMREGTAAMQAAEMADVTEHLGAELQTRAGFDFAALTLSTLNRSLEALLPVVRGVVAEASFPEDELLTHVRNSRQKLRIKEQKPEYLADTGLRAALFGETHPYGYRTDGEVLDALNREALTTHHRATVADGPLTLVVAGKVSPDVRNWLEAAFGGGSRDVSRRPDTSPAWTDPAPSPREPVRIVRPGAVQSAIRLARPAIPKNHPDYPAFFVLNTVLGGFFGSRLMSNIREDKGYTYGIYSTMQHFEKAGYFFITSEVGIQVCKPALMEIRRELKRLRDQPVPAGELDLVRSYLLGSILGSLDGPFATARTVRGLLQAGLAMDHVQHLVDTIQTVQPVDLQALANTYLQEEDFLEYVVGWPEDDS